MGFRFQKRIKIAPGLRLNISKTGISTTVGRNGASVNIGKTGTHSTVGIPGTGLSHRTKHQTAADTIAADEPHGAAAALPTWLKIIAAGLAIAIIVALLR